MKNMDNKMFVKINELYNFFVKSGFQEYANIIEKIALEESDFKEKYPNVYSVWDSNKDRPLSAYIAQISRAEDKGIDLTKESINSFQDIIQILRGEKQKSKSSKADEILKALNKEGLFHITEENVELAFGVGLNTEEIVYLAKDKCNHTWEEKIHYADRFKKERLALFDESVKLTDFKNIDEVRDEFFSRKNSAPLDLQKFYEGIKDQALEDSEVIYNSKNYIVAHSKTEKAAQYWEQSCVTVNERGQVSSGLCSAHPYESFFDYYDDKIHSFQIITKEYETLKETPRTSFVGKNKGYNLITLSIDKNTGNVAWGGQDTVNRYNEEVGPEAFFFALGSEYEEICNKISEYCEKSLNIGVKNLKISEDEAKEMLGVKVFIDMNLEKKKVKFPYDKLENTDSLYFISNFKNFPVKITNDQIIYHIQKISPFSFFSNSETIPKDIFESFAFEKANELGLYEIFDIFESSDVTGYIPKDLLEKIRSKRAKELESKDFFSDEYFKLIPKNVLEDLDLISQKAEDLSSDINLFLRPDSLSNFIRLSEKIPRDIFDKLFDKILDGFTEYELSILKYIPEIQNKDLLNRINNRIKNRV